MSVARATIRARASSHRKEHDMAAYDVQYDKDSGDWSAKRAGASRATGRFDAQQAAHDAARGLAERSGGGEVRDHRKDNNQIRNTDTVGKKDPHPPKG